MVSQSDVVMQYLQSYNTLSSRGYITTLAMAYIPDEETSTLSTILLDAGSSLYNDSDPTVRDFMNLLDPSIPLLAGSTINDVSSSAAVKSSSTNAMTTPVTATPSIQNPATSSNTAGPSSISAGAGAGIAIAALTVILAFAVGIFLLIRKRNERRKLDAHVLEEKAQLEDTSQNILTSGKNWHELSPDRQINELSSRQINELSPQQVSEMDAGDDGLPPEMMAGPFSDRHEMKT